MDKLKVIADYFGVTVDYLIGNEEANDNQEEIDVSQQLEVALESLKNDGDLYFNGKPPVIRGLLRPLRPKGI